jgi:serine/threonine protein kinase
LLYLHEKSEKVVIHRDIKASNVLVHSVMNGRLGDFGLARLYDHGTDLQTTHAVGTMGYMAPKLICTCKASPLTDMFAFGIFLLEVTCEKRPVDHNIDDDRAVFVDWVLKHWREGSLIETVDTRLRGDYDIDEACLVLKLGLLCSHPFTNGQPNINGL